ncbi:MAG: hypothetical protein HYX72_09185 [Acidobacteria bacterium]|nr:hypothetical protein [Acidobacteriota bacterium]
MSDRIRARLLLLVLALSFVGIAGTPPVRSQSDSANRRVYEGVVDLKQKTIGTVILMDINGNNVTGWMRMIKFVPIEGGTITKNSAEFRAAGNSYKIDERKGRITYSGPDGSGDRIVSRLTPLTGVLDEMTESERFSGNNIATLDVDGRLRRFNVQEPSLWKRQGPPFEKFRRVEELLRQTTTFWVSNPERGSIEVIEEPQGMDIPLKAPKKAKEKKEKK